MGKTQLHQPASPDALQRLKALWDKELIPLDLESADVLDILGEQLFQYLVDVDLLLETLSPSFDANDEDLLRHRSAYLFRLQFFPGDDKTRRLRKVGFKARLERKLRNLIIDRRREFCESMERAIRYYHRTLSKEPLQEGVADIAPTPQASEPGDTRAPAGWEASQRSEPGSAPAPTERGTSFNPDEFGGKELCIAVSYQKLKQRSLLVLANILKNKANIRYENKHGDPVTWRRHGGFRQHIHRLRKKAKQEGWYDAIPPGYCISYATSDSVRKRLQQCLTKCLRKAP